jgi:hypothetical protein
LKEKELKMKLLLLSFSVCLYTHACIHAYIPWICKFVMATTGCGISHTDTKHTDKCSNNKTDTTQKQSDKTIDKYFFKIL